MNSTAHVQSFNGIPCVVPNVLLNNIPTEHFYISYNNHDIGVYGCDTTALVLRDQTQFLILNGDHRQQFSEILSNGGRWTDCLAYVATHRDELNHRSDQVDRRWKIDVDENGKLVPKILPPFTED